MLTNVQDALRKVRAGSLALANSLGANNMLGATAWRRQQLLILCYHGVSLADEHEWSDLYVSPGHLERRLQLLRRAGATVLPLDTALSLLQQNALPERAVALTFDDGAADYSIRAAPILADASVHATLYLTTYYCGRRQPVFDTIASYLLWKARERTVRLPGLGETVTIPATTADPAFAAMHNRVRSYALAQHFDADEKHRFARQIAEAVGQDFDALVEMRLLQLMTPPEVAALDSRTTSVQLHTHRHRTPRDRDLFLREIDDNAAIIRALRGDRDSLNHFCYPSGDYVDAYGEWLRSRGVSWATTCDPGLATAASDPMFLPRFVDTEPVSEATFLAWVSGLSNFAFARRRTTPVRLGP
jgi:peptidoglycan/xylan/chitin deacetylase (PgdA/CDA1 family)